MNVVSVHGLIYKIFYLTNPASFFFVFFGNWAAAMGREQAVLSDRYYLHQGRPGLYDTPKVVLRKDEGEIDVLVLEVRVVDDARVADKSVLRPVQWRQE